MHREISHTDSAFEQESNLTLYLMTALLAVLMALDLLPAIAAWLGWPSMAPWPREVGGFRFAFIAAILGGIRVVYSSLSALFEGRIGADLALAIAAVSAIVIREPLVAAEVVLIGMIGECLEAFTFARAQNAVRKIIEIFPRRCWVLRDGQEVRVFTNELQIGDRVVVKPGAKVPVDGVVLDGRSAMNTSALTGESVPLDKGPGDEVLAGSVNQFGALTVEARRVAAHTVAGRVIELTARALKDKANIERTADRLARYFLPAVLAVAALTFVAYLLYFGSGILRPAGAPRLGLRQAIVSSVYPTLAVLVVACPCALILATPAAVIAALGRLAGTGVLIKGGSALERLARVKTMAFDKTGTITEGRLEQGDIISLSDVPADQVLRIAASAEQRSEHPIARAILDEAKRRNLTLDPPGEFRALPGAGVTAGNVLVGTRRLLEEHGLLIGPEAHAALERLDANGQTALLVAQDGRLLGVIGARDRVRPDAAAVLAALRELGIDPIVLLTGDRQAVANAVATGLPFTEIHAELLPEQKAELLTKLQGGRVSDPALAAAITLSPRHLVTMSSPRPGVAMVGDGINDAPALARADVGLAIGGPGGTDIAAEAGDVVLMGDPLRSLPLLVRLSRQMVRIIHQNIVWFAFVVNAIGIVFTAWLWPLLMPEGWYEQSPLAAVVYHQLGSLAVLLNSMRLLWFDRAAESPFWQRLKGRFDLADLWVSRHLDPGELGHWLEHHALGTIAAVVLLLLALYAATGLRIVAPDEVALVRRFGGFHEELAPGWHWRYPWPVDDVTRVSQQVRTVDIGFRTVAGKDRATGALTWSSAHRRENRVPDEALMLTGDGNLLDLLVSVRYRVADPRVFLFEVKNGEDVIRASAEATLRTMVAGRPFPELLTAERGSFQREALRRLKLAADRHGSHGLGVEFDSIAIVDLHPPSEVVDAYYEVARAMERRDQRINAARAKATKMEKAALADSARIVAEARAESAEKVKQAEGETAAFLAYQRARNTLDIVQERRLAVAAVDAVLAGRPADEVEKEWRANRTQRLAQQAALADFRLYWETAAKSLAGRDLVLIDADNVRGQRQLMLFDPDQLRVPIPMMLPPGRAPFKQNANDEGP
jgi:Cu+-exporting ATPase